MKQRPTFQMCFACAFVAVMAFGLCFFVYFSLFDRPYLSYRNLPFPTQIQRVKAGQVIPIRVIRCNRDSVAHNYTTTHSAWSIDQQRPYILTEARIPIEPGCADSISLVNHLPADLPPGKYYVFGSAEVQGVLRTHHVEWRSQPFEVTP